MTIPESDVKLVAYRCQVGRALARRALEFEDGDLAAAIVRIEEGDIPSQEDHSTTVGNPNSDISEADVEIVAERADVPTAKAHDVLLQTDGDLAAAISQLTQDSAASQTGPPASSDTSTGSSTDETTSLYTAGPDSDDSPTKLYSPDSTPAESAQQPTTAYCPECGTALSEPDTANFCSHCGAELQ
ncbi:zinc-ribbon domain-containing protein [Halorubrum ezzemoulense]